jgi:hypothetical protein
VAPDGVSVVFSCSQGCIVLRFEFAMVVQRVHCCIEEVLVMLVSIEDSSISIVVVIVQQYSYAFDKVGVSQKIPCSRLPTNRVPKTVDLTSD